MNLSADEHEAIVAQVQITKLQKKLTNANKQLAKQKKALAVAQAPTEDDFERIPAEEEEPASDAEMGINLISSFRKGPAVTIPIQKAKLTRRPQVTLQHLRRQGSVHAVATPPTQALQDPNRHSTQSDSLATVTNTPLDQDDTSSMRNHPPSQPMVLDSSDPENIDVCATPTPRTTTHKWHCPMGGSNSLSASTQDCPKSSAARSGSSHAPVTKALKAAEFINNESPSGRPKASQYTDDIISHKSNARGDLINEIRKHIAAAYGFVPGDKPAAQRKNVKLYQGLIHESTFHYKDFDLDVGSRSGFLRNTIVTKLIKECFFKNKNSVGIKFRKYFDPIRTPTLALLLTGVEHCIKEWSTGIHAQVAFSEFENKPWYLNHMEDITKWARSSPGVVCNLCKKWHDHARRATGVADDDAPTGHLSAAAIEDAQKELQGHTGEMDSEAEDD
ncbi:hypothetical protein SCP_1403080 [Sparassis crispa]|uniref:DUF6532 domain-containing protein n=1 Tax=Sparassis crispa TaxID=139825 RepID=A0A401H3H1_9APHY|nr:hypothetical protein SCP_1403080 [Sparassis crispa]GBE88900.1 hypothetical protein SCP_1403080 [Sparassis crispa]